MADIALLASTASDVVGSSSRHLSVEESIEQATLIAAVDIPCGSPVKQDANGKFAIQNGVADLAKDAYGVATHFARAGEPVTAVRQGLLGGFNFTAQAYGTDIFASNTVGALGDAAGTVATKVGEVFAVPVSKPAMKGLRVDMRQT